MFEKEPAPTKEELVEREKLFVPGKFVMVRMKKFATIVWTFYEIEDVNQPLYDGDTRLAFGTTLARGMTDQNWVTLEARMEISIYSEYRVQFWDTFEEADHAANYYNLMYRLEVMQKKVMLNLTDAKPTEADSLIVGTDSPGDYMEFFTVLALFSTLAFKDEEEKHLLQEFYAEIEPNIEKYVAKRMLLGKAFA